MAQNTLYLCEKPDQGRKIAEALGGGKKVDGGITGEGWSITWGFGHLLTPYMPHDYNPDYKRWEWEPLPIVPAKFLFKAKDGLATRQIGFIRTLMKQATEVVISTDPDREGELIAYEILNELKWTGPTQRLWLSDLTLPAIKKALASLRDAAETKPLYWAAMARTYADWIVGMNMSRAATLKLAAPGGKPMSVGRVQTPVLAMIVDLERKVTGFKSEDYFEISAAVQTASGTVAMKFAPPAEKRITDLAQAQALLARCQGAKGALSVKTEAKKQAPPPLLDLNALQQECNSRFGWSADKALKVMQALYETHQALTYPRTDSQALPEEHKNNVPVISKNLGALSEFKHLVTESSSLIERSTVYNDKKVTAHHAIVPTNQATDLSKLTVDEKKLFLLVARYWFAAHLPDMEYLQTTITLDANGVPLRAGGRQITKLGWREAFLSPTGQEQDAAEAEEGAESETEDDVTLPPLKDSENGTVTKSQLDKKKTKPPARFTERSLLQAMKNIAAYVEDSAAKKKLKETSGIGTPATRANVIETLKVRDYIKIKKRQISPTETAFVLIDAMRATAPGYADPAMTAQWEDVLEMISQAENMDLMKKFVGGIAGVVRTDVAAIKDSGIKKMVGTPKPGAKVFSGPKLEGDWKAKIDNGTPINVPFDDKTKAKDMGARWHADKKSWVIPEGVDHTPFKSAGWI
ncbi:DNA topoisomerase 3 [Loktanella sp. DJP18]|uniref:DNA topoisomerase 3 n=1 Tax=Loktanella sp. DJP18 TaxID=3409788 RepID=UPI003BB6E5DF